jgi:hypothetical protein
MEAQRGSKEVDLLYLYPQRWKMVGGRRHCATVLTLRKKPIPILEGAVWVFWSFCLSAENVASEIRSSERQRVAFPYTHYDIPTHKNVKK